MSHSVKARPVFGHHRIDHAALDRLRNDPEVEIRRRSTRPVRPFVPEIRVTGPVNELDLIGRNDCGSDDAPASNRR